MSSVKTAAVLIIGNEILSGRTQDVNLNHLAQKLGDRGIRLNEARIVADIEDDIIAALNACRTRYDYVFTTGGIGPTHDDITSACVAKAFGRELALNAQARALLESHYDNPADLNEARLRMAHIPVGAELVHNPISKAPGFRIDNVYVLAGVPSVMRAQFEGIADQLARHDPVQSRSVTAFIGEGSIAAELGVIQARFSGVDIGSYPFMKQGRIGTNLVCRGTDTGALEQAVSAIEAVLDDMKAECYRDQGSEGRGQGSGL